MTGRDWANLQQLLLEAFPTPGELERFVQHRLDKNLAEISTDSNLSDRMFKLIQWTEAHGRTRSLVVAAQRERPDREDLAGFAVYYERAYHQGADGIASVGATEARPTLDGPIDTAGHASGPARPVRESVRPSRQRFWVKVRHLCRWEVVGGLLVVTMIVAALVARRVFIRVHNLTAAPLALGAHGARTVPAHGVALRALVPEVETFLSTPGPLYEVLDARPTYACAPDAGPDSFTDRFWNHRYLACRAHDLVVERAMPFQGERCTDRGAPFPGECCLRTTDERCRAEPVRVSMPWLQTLLYPSVGRCLARLSDDSSFLSINIPRDVVPGKAGEALREALLPVCVHEAGGSWFLWGAGAPPREEFRWRTRSPRHSDDALLALPVRARALPEVEIAYGEDETVSGSVALTIRGHDMWDQLARIDLHPINVPSPDRVVEVESISGSEERGLDAYTRHVASSAPRRAFGASPVWRDTGGESWRLRVTIASPVTNVPLLEVEASTFLRSIEIVSTIEPARVLGYAQCLGVDDAFRVSVFSLPTSAHPSQNATFGALALVDAQRNMGSWWLPSGASAPFAVLCVPSAMSGLRRVIGYSANGTPVDSWIADLQTLTLRRLGESPPECGRHNDRYCVVTPACHGTTVDGRQPPDPRCVGLMRTCPADQCR